MTKKTTKTIAPNDTFHARKYNHISVLSKDNPGMLRPGLSGPSYYANLKAATTIPSFLTYDHGVMS